MTDQSMSTDVSGTKYRIAYSTVLLACGLVDSVAREFAKPWNHALFEEVTKTGLPVIESPPWWATENERIKVILVRSTVESTRRIRPMLCMWHNPAFTTVRMAEHLGIKDAQIDWTQILNDLVHGGLVEGELVLLRPSDLAVMDPHGGLLANEP
jgi:hypothetical protein